MRRSISLSPYDTVLRDVTGVPGVKPFVSVTLGNIFFIGTNNPLILVGLVGLAGLEAGCGFRNGSLCFCDALWSNICFFKFSYSGSSL